MNMLMRAFSVTPAVNSQGIDTGGIFGFLRSLNKLVRDMNPTRVIIVWDGKDGSRSRKMVNSNYKATRDQASVIHWDAYDSKKEELQSVWKQATRLQEYLDYLPVTTISMDKLEADDVIAYLARAASFKNRKAIIVSSDKDFLQLIDTNVSVYSPSKKVLFDRQNVVEAIGVLPENYNILKALTGDKSDNVRGVKGIALKTAVKLFPGLLNDSTYSLEKLYAEGGKNLGKAPGYANVINSWNTVETNFRLMDLHDSLLTLEEKREVAHLSGNEVHRLMVVPFICSLEQDKLEGLAKNIEAWLDVFRYLQYY